MGRIAVVIDGNVFLLNNPQMEHGMLRIDSLLMKSSEGCDRFCVMDFGLHLPLRDGGNLVNLNSSFQRRYGNIRREEETSIPERQRTKC